MPEVTPEADDDQREHSLTGNLLTYGLVNTVHKLIPFFSKTHFNIIP
jgi:hypothetical protein